MNEIMKWYIRQSLEKEYPNSEIMDTDVEDVLECVHEDNYPSDILLKALELAVIDVG